MHNAIMLLNKAVYPNEDWGLVFATVITGLVVVFIILLLLIGIIELMGRAFSGGKGKSKSSGEKPEPLAAPRNIRSKQEPIQASNSGDEIIAVISAAIAAIGESEGKSYSVTSIKKKEKPLRSGWANAGIKESMRPFSN